jgi:alkylated DNA repair dioxygenase AlkB
VYQPKLSDAAGVDFAPEILVARDGIASYDPYFLVPQRADHLYHSLLAGVAWSQDFISMYGKRIPLPRLTAWYGDRDACYTYSGIANRPHPWTPELRTILDELFARTGVRFNSVLLNQYRTGNDSLSWHADDEKELGSDPVVASVSLGATRRFELKHRDEATIAIDLQHGSLLVMSGPLQHFWKHRIPKQKDAVGTRINLTFRVVDASRNHKTTVRKSSK